MHGLLKERGVAGNTVLAYQRDLQQLAQYATGRLPRQVSIQWSAVDRPLLRDFLLELERRGYAKTSVTRKAAAIRSFFAFLTQEGSIRSNPADSLRAPPVGKVTPRVLSPHEVKMLVMQPSSRSTPEAKRDRAMLQLLSTTGIRVSELVSLDVTSLHLDGQPSVRCPGKGAKKRSIPLSDEAAEALRLYLDEARLRLLRDRKETALFLNQRGARLTRQGFWLMFKRHAEAASLGSRISPRHLRHSCAARMLSEGIPVSTVQKVLGHACPGTTRAYLTLAGREKPPDSFSN